MPRSRPRRSRICRPAAPSRSVAVERDRSPLDPDAAARQQAHDRQRGDRLAAAGLADQADGLPRRATSKLTRRRRRVERLGSAAAGEGRPAGRARRSRALGSAGHRRLFGVEGLPQRLADQGEAERHHDDARRPARTPGAGACRSTFCALPSICPHSGWRVVGVAEAEERQRRRVDDRGRQRPAWPARSPGRASSAACAGTRWRRRLTPSARAASTWSLRAGPASSRAAAGRRSAPGRSRWR